MITPKPLGKGDVVGLVSTARKISRGELEPAIHILRSWGLKVKTAPNLFEQSAQFAGTDQQRKDDLQQFIDDPQIKAIICVRGGYGTIRIIDSINFFALLENPKWICGYSDVTVLLNRLLNTGIESLHAPMPVGFETNTRESLKSFRNTLFGEPEAIVCSDHPLNIKGECYGRLIGGNLSVLYSQLGSPTALDTTDCILFIEDLDEYLYHIDRMMMNLKRNNYFSKLAGLIVGGMTDMNDNKVPFGETAEEIVSRIVSPYGFPVCFGFPAGHIANNTTLIMGRKAKLSIGKKVKLLFNNGRA